MQTEAGAGSIPPPSPARSTQHQPGVTWCSRLRRKAKDQRSPPCCRREKVLNKRNSQRLGGTMATAGGAATTAATAAVGAGAGAGAGGPAVDHTALGALPGAQHALQDSIRCSTYWSAIMQVCGVFWGCHSHAPMGPRGLGGGGGGDPVCGGSM
jgi:hypothetical protein